MSRSNPQANATNPATRFFQWHGDTGTFSYYDKTEKKNVDVPFPFRFLVLDVVAQVGGGIKRYNEYVGYFSNMVRPFDLKKRPFVVKSRVNNRTNVEGEGLWADVKTRIPGAKFVSGIFCAYFDEDNVLQIGFIKFQGAAGSAWFDFNKGRQVDSGVHKLTGRSEPKQNGNTTYYEPTFSWSDKVSEESSTAAFDLDVQLQAYLNAYFEQGRDMKSEDDNYQQQLPDTGDDAYTGPPQVAAAAPASSPTPAPVAAPVAANDDDEIPF